MVKVVGYYMFAVMAWLLENPDSTAYEVTRGLELRDAWKVYTMLLSAERSGAVSCSRSNGELVFRWKVIEGQGKRG